MFVRNRICGTIGIAMAFAAAAWAAATRHETFDHEPPRWEGVNNRSTNFSPRRVTQNFGYSATTSHAGGSSGEIGGLINPAAEPAYYGLRLNTALDFGHPISISGKLLVPAGPNHCLMGFFNPATLNGWRTPNTSALRINGRKGGFHCHLEYCTSRGRAGAGV